MSPLELISGNSRGEKLWVCSEMICTGEKLSHRDPSQACHRNGEEEPGNESLWLPETQQAQEM